MFEKSVAIDEWSKEHHASFGSRFQVSQHRLHEMPMFDESSLIDLLNELPRHQLQAYTLAPDAERMDSIQAVDPDHCSGRDLYQAVHKGLFWFNLKCLETFDIRYQQLLEKMFDQLLQHCPQVRGAQDLSCDMLITSANSHTHFHMDRGPSILWHLSGEKQLWCYPALDTSLVSQEDIEHIYGGDTLEYTPYSKEFDKVSVDYKLRPGDLVSWPNSSPHRVENLTPCVSINVSYATPASVRRVNIQRANRYIMKPLGFRRRSMQEHGFFPDLKQLTYRFTNRFCKFGPEKDFRNDYATDLRINIAEPNCLETTSTKSMPAFLSPSKSS